MARFVTFPHVTHRMWVVRPASDQVNEILVLGQDRVPGERSASKDRKMGAFRRPNASRLDASMSNVFVIHPPARRELRIRPDFHAATCGMVVRPPRTGGTHAGRRLQSGKSPEFLRGHAVTQHLQDVRHANTHPRMHGRPPQTRGLGDAAEISILSCWQRSRSASYAGIAATTRTWRHRSWGGGRGAPSSSTRTFTKTPRVRLTPPPPAPPDPHPRHARDLHLRPACTNRSPPRVDTTSPPAPARGRIGVRATPMSRP